MCSPITHLSLRGAGAMVAVAGLGLFGLTAMPAGASAGGATPAPVAKAERPMAVPHAPAALPPGTHQACAAPTRVGQMQCLSIIRNAARRLAGNRAAAPIAGSYGPADLQSAYSLASAAASNGAGATVAVVDAYNDPNAASDLAAYRSNYGLPACTTGSGCFKIVNQNGQASPLPGPDPTGTGGWEFEESLDLDMVSAVCPKCAILLVEANTSSTLNLGTAENSAVRLGAKFVSNSWDGFDYPGDASFDSFFNHPGVATAFASGDFGFGTGYPASSQFVTSVGGTFLTRDAGVPRGWDETVWNDANGATGSGCSVGGAKPSWQTMDNSSPNGCLNRTQTDVSAVADGPVGLAVFDTFPMPGAPPGWQAAGGTSAATPIITSVYALAGTPAQATYPSSYLYQSGHAGELNDITSGSNGTCEPGRQYLCTARAGYDGPTGWGTPNGTSAFANTATGDVVTQVNPGTQDFQAGSKINIPTSAISTGGQTPTITATGLPPGVSLIGPQGGIAGTLPSTAATYPVTLTAKDPSGASDSVTFNIVAVPSLRTGFHPVAGPTRLNLGGKCLDDTNNSSANGTKVQIWTCNGGAAQNWTYTPNGNPGGAGVLTIHGKCLDIIHNSTANGAKIDLWPCTGGPNQQWYIVGFAGELFNPASGKCLDDTARSTTNGTQVEIWTCNGNSNQAWTLPASPIQSGVAGKCVDDFANGTANGTKIDLYSCNGRSTQNWTIGLDGSLRIKGKCLDVTNSDTRDGAPLQLFTCNSNVNTNANQLWFIGAAGQLENINSGKCLADPGDTTVNGTQLVQEDCYSNAGEIWAVS